MPYGEGGGEFSSGTRLIFHQTTAPTGWAKETNPSYNNTALRIVTGTIGSNIGNSFTTALVNAFTSDVPSTNLTSVAAAGTTDGPSTNLTSANSPGTTDGPSTNLTSANSPGTTDLTTLSIAQIPSHTHNYTEHISITGAAKGSVVDSLYQTSATSATGGGGAHSHTFSTTHQHDLGNHTHTINATHQHDLGNHTHTISATHQHDLGNHTHNVAMNLSYHDVIIAEKL